MGYLHVVRPAVVDESIDGEVIIVNLDKGLYFSTDGVGGHIWGMVAAGRSVEEIHSWASSAYTDADPEALSADVTAFLDALCSNALVTAADDPPADAGEAVDTAAPPYSKPELQVYSDMEELLLLDPIHEVDEQAGWPHTTSDAGSAPAR